MRNRSALYLALLALGCRTWEPTPAPPGVPMTQHPPVESEPVIPALAMKSSESGDDAAALSTGIDAFRALVARRGTVRVITYYNQQLNSGISGFRSPGRGVIEIDYQESGPRGKTTAKKTVTVHDAQLAQQVAGSGDLAALIAHRLEAALNRHLLQGNARVVDNALLMRQSAQKTSASTYSEAELRALSGDVDVLLEVRFVPNFEVDHGFEVSMRAIRTRDAAVLASASSTELKRVQETKSIQAVSGVGYQEVHDRKEMPLQDVFDAVAGSLMQQIAARY